MCVLKSRLLSQLQYFQSYDNTANTVLKCVHRYTGGDNVSYVILSFFAYFILMLNFVRATRNQQIVSVSFYCIIARYQIV